MKQTIDKSFFINNSILGDAFSYDAREALYDYFEELEQDIGEEIEFDPIAIRCEWTEYASLVEVALNYTDLNDIEDDEDRIEWCNDRTQIIELSNGGILLADF